MADQKRRVPCWLKWLVAVVFICGAGFYASVILPYQREQAAIPEIELSGGAIEDWTGWFGMWRVAKVSTGDSANLKFLKHDGTFTDDTMEGLTALTEIYWLILDSPRVTDRGVRHLSTMRNLRYMWLHLPQLTDRGLETIGSLQLEVLKIVGSQRITDAGIQSLRNMKSLQYLTLVNCAVTEVGVSRLKSELPLCGISLWRTD